ncbi:hypothetical protein [Proteiniclasticum ruminis]|jgi:hypothetical protein|uniref:Uncharacterized protein n=1 Tax=Proteiniclasticum ruminis TaxID=398199 RepID=A0A1G8GRT1_9CLOT|nr:hypothetical protein [Proteiniclasticum ruminis]SDH96971.1 hypothetical protein SAMN05421804_101342 [Proteiniclasticum ruminis]
MMSVEEIKEDLDNFLKGYYKNTFIEYLDVAAKVLELRLVLGETERKYVQRFYEDNKQMFTEATSETEKDLERIDAVYLRIDNDGVFFGKSSFDLTASNSAVYYLLSRYLEEMVEILPDKMKEYEARMLLQ